MEKIFEHYETGELFKKYSTKNGKIEGLFEMYHENGVIDYRGFYKDGNSNGKSETFRNDGNLRSTCSMKNGVIDGESIWYYRNGNIYDKSTYNNGNIIRYERWFKNGQISKLIEFDSGGVETTKVRWTENGVEL